MDDITRSVARVYAESLYRVAAGQKQEAEILAELEALQGMLMQADPRVRHYVTSSSLGRDRRKAVFSAFEGRASDILVNFLYVLNEHDRLDALMAVIIAYQDLYDQKAGRMRVAVRSAVALSDQQMERLREQLRTAFGREPIVHSEVDPELLGGLVVEVDGWLYDNSVRNRLRTLRNQISEKGSYEIQSGRDRFSSAAGN